MMQESAGSLVDDALQRSCMLPLSYGTGTSPRTIEAMTGGKAMLDTAVAFQGLEVTSAIGVVVEDDLERMAELPGDDAGRRRITAVPRWFAARSDNHAAYHAYLRQLEFSLWRRIRIGG
jgi:hypothetical protein